MTTKQTLWVSAALVGLLAVKAADARAAYLHDLNFCGIEDLAGLSGSERSSDDP